MLIQDNSNTILTKYISIYLKDTFNQDIEVSSIYNNPTMGYYNIGTQVITNGYIAFPIYSERILPDETIIKYVDSYVYGFVTYFNSNVITPKVEYSEYDTGSTLAFNGGKTINFDIELDLDDDNITNLKIIHIDPNTGKLKERQVGDFRYFSYFTADEINNCILQAKDPDNPVIRCITANCRQYDSLCGMIYEWLKDRFPFLPVKDDIETFYGDIANYFLFGNIYFNRNKLPYDIDDMIGFFLFDRVITERSSHEDIEYAYNLLRYNRNVIEGVLNIPIDKKAVPGKWDNLHDCLYKYQMYLNKSNQRFTDFDQDELDRLNTETDKVNYRKSVLDSIDNLYSVVIPTGYLDPITERYLLSEFVGDGVYEYSSNNRNNLRTY